MSQQEAEHAGEQGLQAPILGHCPRCRRSVIVIRPRVDDATDGRFTVRGECLSCGSEVVLDLPGPAAA